MREQLFAEAVVAYRRGDRYWPTADDEVRFFKPQQDRRQEDDPWFTTIAEALETSTATKFTIAWIARTFLGFDGDSRIGKAEQNRITIILKELQCKPLPRSGSGDIGNAPR